MKEELYINEKTVEVRIIKTSLNDFISTANFKGEVSYRICRHRNKQKSRDLSIERLINNELLLKKKHYRLTR